MIGANFIKTKLTLVRTQLFVMTRGTQSFLDKAFNYNVLSGNLYEQDLMCNNTSIILSPDLKAIGSFSNTGTFLIQEQFSKN